jgi:hypothetical protein
MMSLFRRQNTWDKVTSKAADAVPMKAVKSGAAAVGTAVGATLLSAAVSAARQRQEKSSR